MSDLQPYLNQTKMMPFEKFTARARKVVDLASAEATRLGDEPVDTVHLLIGMIREGEGVAGKVLAEFEIKVDAVIDAYQSTRTHSDVTMTEVESRCIVEAEWFKHNYVGTEHLLLSVCGFMDSKAAKLLIRIGKPPAEICQLAVEIIGHGFEWNRWLAAHPELGGP